MENNEAKKEESAAGNTGTGDIAATGNMLERTEHGIKRLAEENARIERNIAECKAIMARELLAGRSEGGIPPVAPVKLTPQEYAKKVMRGEANPLKEDGFIR